MYNRLPAISAFAHKPLEGYIKTVSIGYIWRVKNEGRRKRNVCFAIYTLLLLLSSCSVISDSAPPWTACSMPGFPVLHYLPESAQTHVHWVDNAIQLSHPLSAPSPPALNLSQHQGLFQWVSTSHQVAKVLEPQHQSFQWTFRVDFLWDWLVWSPCYPRDSQESSLAPQFKSIISLALSLLYGPTLTSVHDYWKNHSFDYMDLCQKSDFSAF